MIRKYIAAVALACTCLPFAASAQITGYTLVELPTLPAANSFSNGNAISQNGIWTAGTSGITTINAVRWNNGGATDAMSMASNVQTRGFGVNNSGIVVGEQSSGGVRGFYSTGSGSTLMQTLGGTYSSLRSVNNAGVAVGGATNAAGRTKAVKFDTTLNQITDLGFLPGEGSGSYSYAYAINDSGNIVGEAWQGSSLRAFYLPAGGSMQNLGLLTGYVTASARAISSNNIIAGLTTSSTSRLRAFVKQPAGPVGLLPLLSIPYEQFAQANGVNASGLVVGASSASPQDVYTGRAVIWKDGKIYDLNGLIYNPTNLTLHTALAINDQGKITGIGRPQNFGTARGYILTPLTPDPSEPAPEIVSFSQNRVPLAANPDYEITINGSGFSDSSRVIWDGAYVPTTYISSSQIKIKPTYIQTQLVGNYPVFVRNIKSGKTSITATIEVFLNNAPTPVSDNYDVIRNKPTVLNVLSNDTDPDPGDSLILDSFYINPTHGAAVIQPDNTVLYTPEPGYVGTDAFYYIVKDTYGGFQIAIVDINVVVPPPGPVIISVEATPQLVVSGDTINVIAKVEANGSPVSEVKLFGNQMTFMGSDLYEGSFTASGLPGKYFIEISAKDQDEVVQTDSTQHYILGRIITIRTSDANQPIINQAQNLHMFKVTGKVTLMGANEMDIDDGSKKAVRFKGMDTGQFSDGDHAVAWGTLEYVPGQQTILHGRFLEKVEP